MKDRIKIFLNIQYLLETKKLNRNRNTITGIIILLLLSVLFGWLIYEFKDHTTTFFININIPTYLVIIIPTFIIGFIWNIIDFFKTFK